ncbi:hypothetical protein RF11_13392 [Thelohanellus kitauei]|uniref:Uncharacterized protein n=1 Tax=Thelohanellus kitauei TaxID=669202 RepID=A0A0C2M775_THEKT|nr:hypothetical protein RF11_13392 [Thelohanellus kitauei]
MLLTFYVFSPNLMTTTINETCNIKHDARKIGLVVFTENSTKSHSVFRNFNRIEIVILIKFLILAYILQFVRIYIAQASPKGSSIFKILASIWIVKRINTDCVKEHLSILVRFPTAIFCLNSLEILLFFCYHIKIDTRPLRITFIFKEEEKIFFQLKHVPVVNNEVVVRVIEIDTPGN